MIVGNKSVSRFDVIVVGGGHNGLVTATLLGESGLRVAVLEARDLLGGPAGTFEIAPGYRVSAANSPGSLEPRIVQALELERHGLRFVKPDPTVVQPLENGRCFVGWRDSEKADAQYESFGLGEANRYRELMNYIEAFARKLSISLYEPAPELHDLVANLRTLDDQEAFGRIILGSAKDLLDQFLLSPYTKAVVAPLATVGGLAAPSTPCSASQLLFRPLALASASGHIRDDDPRKMPLRGSTGLPIGGMGAIVDAMHSAAMSKGVHVVTHARARRIHIGPHNRVTGVETSDGRFFEAPIVVSSCDPLTTVRELLDPSLEEWKTVRTKLERVDRKGRAFKVVLLLGALPHWELPIDFGDKDALVSSQFRVAPSMEYLENGYADLIAGRIPEKPVMWGLVPTVTSPELAPPGKHIMSINVTNVPRQLRSGNWSDAREIVARRCVSVLSEWMPNLEQYIEGIHCVDPEQFERDFGLVVANIIHGDMLPGSQFWMRPLPGLHRNRTPTPGLYLGGNGTWPGNFVSGISGYNAAMAVLADMKASNVAIAERV